METVSALIPGQRVPPSQLDVSPYERGSAGASRVHAVRKTLNGLRALCNPGLPVTRLAGRFDSGEPDACEECAYRLHAATR